VFLKLGDAETIYTNSYEYFEDKTLIERFNHSFLLLTSNKGNNNITDFINNIIAFIPFGFALPLLLKSKKLLKVILWSAGFTLFVECLQMFTGMGGMSLIDLVANIIGGLTGSFAFVLFNKIIKNANIKKSIIYGLFIFILILSIYAIYTIIKNFDLFFKMIFSLI